MNPKDKALAGAKSGVWTKKRDKTCTDGTMNHNKNKYGKCATCGKVFAV